MKFMAKAFGVAFCIVIIPSLILGNNIYVFIPAFCFFTFILFCLHLYECFFDSRCNIKDIKKNVYWIEKKGNKYYVLAISNYFLGIIPIKKCITESYSIDYENMFGGISTSYRYYRCSFKTKKEALKFISKCKKEKKIK